MDTEALERVELELSRPSGFTTTPAALPPGVSASLSNGALVYGIGPNAEAFPTYRFTLNGSGAVTLVARAYSSQGEVGRSETRSFQLDEGSSSTLPIAGGGLNPDCSMPMPE